MKPQRNILTFLTILLLVICRVGAVAHAAEHTFEHDDEYCEVCSLSEHNADGLVKPSVVCDQIQYQSYFDKYLNPYFASLLAWDSLSRAPPVFS